LEEKYEKEIIIRVLFKWINEVTGGLLNKRKKKILLEIYKQLFSSSKKNLTIKLSKEFSICKKEKQASIVNY
jgi:hypothetical protein